MTSGFDLWIDEQEINPDGARIKFNYNGENEKYAIAVCLSDENTYKAYLNGEKLKYNLRNSSALEFTLDGSVKSGELIIKKI